jgi:acyl-CoA thioesterase
LVRATTLADFSGGLSGALSAQEWSFANLDIAIHLMREPLGEWLLMDATMASSGNGVAVTNAIMADRQGVFARSHQTLFVAPRNRI